MKKLQKETNAVGGGNVAGTGGNPLGRNMKPQHKVLWSGDEEDDHNTLKEFITSIVENVLDDMGHTKATSSIRKGMVGGGEVYLDRDDANKGRSKSVVDKVAKNLNKKPYSHDPPRMGLGESIVRLLEAKIDQEIQRYSDDPNMTAFLSALKLNGVLPKYVPWLVSQAKDSKVLINRTPDQAKNIASGWLQKVNRFEKMVQLNQMPQDKRDINKFHDFEDLLQWTQTAENKYKEKSTEKEAKSQATKIYEDAEYLLIEPKSEKASCVYGRDTQWCISATDSRNYFNEYSGEGARFLFVINKKTNDKDAIAFSGYGVGLEIYDAKDEKISEIDVALKYPDHILEKIKTFLQGEGENVELFVKVNENDLQTDPVEWMKDGSKYKILRAMALDKGNTKRFFDWALAAVDKILEMRDQEEKTTATETMHLLLSRMMLGVPSAVINEEDLLKVVFALNMEKGFYKYQREESALMMAGAKMVAKLFRTSTDWSFPFFFLDMKPIIDVSKTDPEKAANFIEIAVRNQSQRLGIDEGYAANRFWQYVNGNIFRSPIFKTYENAYLASGGNMMAYVKHALGYS
jgi:hypothetical protein